MEININGAAEDRKTIFHTISEERFNKLTMGAAQIQAKYSMNRDPSMQLMKKLAKKLKGEIPDEDRDEEYEKFLEESEDLSYYTRANLYKEIVELCDNIEEVVLILPAVADSFSKMNESNTNHLDAIMNLMRNADKTNQQ